MSKINNGINSIFVRTSELTQTLKLGSGRRFFGDLSDRGHKEQVKRLSSGLHSNILLHLKHHCKGQRSGKYRQYVKNKINMLKDSCCCDVISLDT